MSRRIASDRFRVTTLVLVFVALCGYALPCIVAPVGAMTLNGHDLAEWASLVPSQRAASPPLLAPLLLRMQPMLLSLLLGLIAGSRRRMALTAAAIFLLAASQLPPFEFVHDINNLNYRQQFSLAAFSLVAGLCLIPLDSRRLTLFLTPLIAAAGLLTSVFGLSMSLGLYGAYQINAFAGAGIWALSFSYGAMIAIALREIWIARSTTL